MQRHLLGVHKVAKQRDNAPLTRSFHLNVKENQHATKRSLLVEKRKDFPTKNVLIRSLKTV